MIVWLFVLSVLLGFNLFVTVLLCKNNVDDDEKLGWFKEYVEQRFGHISKKFGEIDEKIQQNKLSLSFDNDTVNLFQNYFDYCKKSHKDKIKFIKAEKMECVSNRSLSWDSISGCYFGLKTEKEENLEKLLLKLVEESKDE